ncbi:MAG: transposase [Sphingobacteriales bacterium]|nr:transposase [Sphingobacteriales bacterium]
MEQGTFERPPASHNDHFCITSQQLQFILQGVILKTVRQKSGLPANNSTIAILSEIPVNTAFQAIISMIFVLPVNILQTVSHIASGNSFIDYKILFEQERSHNIELRLQIQSLQLQLAELKKMLFGGRAEKFVTANATAVSQPELFPDDKLGQIDVVKTTLVKEYQKQQTKLTVKHPGRNPLPESLRREVIELMPKEDVKGLHPVGKEITEKLEYRPGELFVKQYVRPEYIKPSNDGLNASRIIASLPAMPLEKSVAGASLLTHLLVSKFVDHLPVYRQLAIFKRQNVNINHSTVSGWIKDAMRLIEPVYDLHCWQVLNTNYLNVDETTIKVWIRTKNKPHIQDTIGCITIRNEN